jgi:ribosomal protein L5
MMNLQRPFLYHVPTVNKDLSLKLKFLNFNELPKVLKIKLAMKKPTLKKKKLLILIYKLFLISFQIPFLKINKKENLKFNVSNLNTILSKNNKTEFIEQIIDSYLPVVKNLKKLNTKFLIKGNFFYKLPIIKPLSTEIPIFMSGEFFNNITIKTSTKNNKIAGFLFNLFLMPLQHKTNSLNTLLLI